MWPMQSSEMDAQALALQFQFRDSERFGHHRFYRRVCLATLRGSGHAHFECLT